MIPKKLIMKWVRFPLILTCIISSYSLFAFYSSASITTPKNKNINMKNVATETTPTIHSECKLKHLNPWHPSLLSYMKDPKPLKLPEKKDELTYFEDGFIILNESLAREGTECQWQCEHHIYGRNYYHGKWEPISKPVNCELFHVQCFIEGHSSRPYYRAPYLELKPKTIPLRTEKGYNVHILIFDSTSHSHALRSLPKSLSFLKHELGAFDFPFYNKVGFNSMPNGYAALVGKHVYSNPKVTPTFAKFINDSQTYQSHYIGNIFERGGYATLLSEDVYSVFFYEKLKPMHLIFRFLNAFPYTEIFQGFNFMLRFLSQFIRGYGNKPKFSLTWNTRLAHDGPTTLFAADDLFVEFLIEHKEEVSSGVEAKSRNLRIQ